MHQKQIARRYASAFFELLCEKDVDISAIIDECVTIKEFYREQSELQQIIEDPTVKVSVKRTVFEKILAECNYDLLKDFIRTLIVKDRFSCIDEIIDELKELFNSQQQIERVVVFSKDKLMKQHITRLKKAFKSYLKNDVEVENIQDPDIIGGIIVKIGDEVIDGTINHQLSQMREKFNKE